MTLDPKAVETLEGAFKRPLSDDERATAEACAPFVALAFICIEERISPLAAKRLAGLFGATVDHGAQRAAQAAATIVAMERLAPGSVTDDDEGGKRGH